MTPELLDQLLAPIAVDAPAGADLSYSLEFDAIRAARKGDDPSLAQGDWVTQFKAAKWPAVRLQCETLLRERTKDLQVGVWYADALAHLEGFQGFAFGLQVLVGLVDQYWPSLFPKGEAGDLEERISKFEWLDAQVPLVLRSAPMTQAEAGGYSFLMWEESLDVENLGMKDAGAKEAALAEGKLEGDAFDRAVRQSGAAYYKTLDQAIGTCLQTCELLQERMDQAFGADGPALLKVQETLQVCHRLSGQLRSSFPGARREPEAPVVEAASMPTMRLDPVAAEAGPVASRQDAVKRLRDVAKYFKSHEPHSPVGPLVDRAAAWAEMSLDSWLDNVIKDTATLAQLRELLDLPASNGS